MMIIERGYIDDFLGYVDSEFEMQSQRMLVKSGVKVFGNIIFILMSH